MTSNDGNAEALVQRGLQLYSQGDLEKALELWRSALTLDPQMSRATEYIQYVEQNRKALESSFHDSGVGAAAAAAPAAAVISHSGTGELELEEHSLAGGLPRGAINTDIEASGGAGLGMDMGGTGAMGGELELDLGGTGLPPPAAVQMEAEVEELDVEDLDMAVDVDMDEDSLADNEATVTGYDIPPAFGLEEPTNATSADPNTLPGGPLGEVTMEMREPALGGVPPTEGTEGVAPLPDLGSGYVFGGEPSELSNAPDEAAKDILSVDDLISDTPSSNLQDAAPAKPPAPIAGDNIERLVRATRPVSPTTQTIEPTDENGDEEERSRRFTAPVNPDGIRAQTLESTQAASLAPPEEEVGQPDLLGDFGGSILDERSANVSAEFASLHATPVEAVIPDLPAMEPEAPPEKRAEPEKVRADETDRVSFAEGESTPASFSRDAPYEPPSLEDALSALEDGFEPADKTPVVDTPPAPAGGNGTPETSVESAEELFTKGDFEQAMEACNAVLAQDPADEDTVALAEKVRGKLIETYEGRLGDLDSVPVVQMPEHAIASHKLDHHAGFLLSRIDGMLSFNDVLDICGMPRFDACRILVQLLDKEVISARR